MQVVVTSSEDASVMVWDYESGEFERSLKGHTGSVNDVAFSSTGALLCTCAHLQICLHMCAYIYTCMNTYTYMCIYAHLRMHICKCAHACSCEYAYIHV